MSNISLAQHEEAIQALKLIEDALGLLTIQLGSIISPTPEESALRIQRRDEWIAASLTRRRAEITRDRAYPEEAYLRQRALDKPLTEIDYFVTPNQYY